MKRDKGLACSKVFGVVADRAGAGEQNNSRARRFAAFVEDEQTAGGLRKCGLEQERAQAKVCCRANGKRGD